MVSQPSEDEKLQTMPNMDEHKLQQICEELCAHV